MGSRRGRTQGQALVEFAIALPILILVVAGVLELGRGYSYAVAVSDAARDGARYVAGKTATTNGPGITAMCNLIKADLAAVTTNVSCATQVTIVPPRPGVDYTVPVGGQPSTSRQFSPSTNTRPAWSKTPLLSPFSTSSK